MHIYIYINKKQINTYIYIYIHTYPVHLTRANQGLGRGEKANSGRAVHGLSRALRTRVYWRLES